MALTTAQLATLKAAIIADPVAGPIRTSGDSVALLAWCNGASLSTAWTVAVAAQVSDEAATYTSYDSIVAGKRDSWGIFLKFGRNFTKNKVRNWITDVWGNATVASIAEAILIAGTEPCTNAQLVFAGTVKTTGTVAALDRIYSESIGSAEVGKLIN